MQPSSKTGLEYIEQAKRQRSGSKKVRSNEGDFSLRCCGDFLEAIYSPPFPLLLFLLGFFPSNGSSKRTIRVVSSRRCLKVFRPPPARKEWGNRDCSCQSSRMGRWRGEKERETLRLLERPPVSEFCHRIFPIHTEMYHPMHTLFDFVCRGRKWNANGTGTASISYRIRGAKSERGERGWLRSESPSPQWKFLGVKTDRGGRRVIQWVEPE